MPRGDRERLADALNAARLAVSFAGLLDTEALASDPKTLAAIKYELVILGEAAAGMSEAVIDRAPDLPWGEMRGLRNALAHEYFRIDVAVIHQLVTEELPAPLPQTAQPQLAQLLEDC